MQVLGEIRQDVARIARALKVLWRPAGASGSRSAARGGDRLLLRRHDGAGACPKRRRHRGRSGLSQRSVHLCAAGCQAHQGRILVCIGADDPLIPPEQRAEFEREMREGKVNWQLSLYGGAVHGFTNPGIDRRGRPDTLRYHAQSTRAPGVRCWGCSRNCFQERPHRVTRDRRAVFAPPVLPSAGEPSSVTLTRPAPGGKSCR